jgi:3-hydroxyisobutyrate dehydrogenase-like beta-hydroxyacid dehydrogenase
MDIGFIGVGNMGMPMAINLLEDGHKLTVYDANSAPLKKLEDMGATLSESPKNVASGVESIFLSLPDHIISEKVMLGENGVLKGAKPKQIIVDATTSMPSVARKISDNAKDQQVSYLDAAVSGGPDGAVARSLTFLVGGDESGLNQIRPAMEKMAKKIFYIGPSGFGTAMKLINNLITICNTASFMEALILGAKVGIQPQTLFEVISNCSGNSYAFQKKAPRILGRDFATRFSLDNEYKDIFLATNLGAEMQVPLFMGNIARELFEMGKAKALGKEDNVSLIKVLESLSGVVIK